MCFCGVPIYVLGRLHKLSLTHPPLRLGDNSSAPLMPQVSGDILELGCLPNGRRGHFPSQANRDAVRVNEKLYIHQRAGLLL